jgi:hypothetical protein
VAEGAQAVPVLIPSLGDGLEARERRPGQRARQQRSKHFERRTHRRSAKVR